MNQHPRWVFSLGLLLGAAAWFGLQRLLDHRQEHELVGQALLGPYAGLSNSLNDIVLLFDEPGRIVAANDRAVEAYGYTHEELLALSMRDLRESSAVGTIAGLTKEVESQGSVVFETLQRRKDGSLLWVEVSSRQAELRGKRYRQSIIRDITVRKASEERLRQVTRALRVLSSCNKAVVRAGEAERLLEEICETIVDAGGYPMAWIGFAQHDAGKSVRVMSAAGGGKSYLDSVQITWGDEPLGRGPTGTCIRTGEVAVCNDLQSDATFTPWRPVADHYGYKSSISLPLRSEGAVIGALALYAEEAGAFYPEERGLLEELAGDVSYGIEARRRQQALERAEGEFRTVFDRANDGILITDLEGRILEVNAVACKRLQYSHDELCRMRVHDISSPAYAELAPQRLAELAKHGHLTFEAERLRKDGSRFPVEINACLFQYRGVTANLAMVRDITERKQAEAEAASRAQELERAKTEAEAASRAKSDFLTHMSHEMRTPMNGVIGMTGLLLDTPLSQDQREFAETIRISADALLAVINDILDLAKIEAGRMELEFSPFDIVDCLQEVGELLAPQARTKGLQYEFHADAEHWAVIGDGGRVRQIVLNLLGNAIKFTDSGSVELRLSWDQTALGRAIFAISVRDSGIGIAPDKLPLLFTKFTQVDSSLVRRHEGTGLGLAISRQLAELMGGTLSVESQAGRGSEFLLRLPLGQAGMQALASSVARDWTARPAVSGRLRRVLLAEDNIVNQKLGVRVLEKLGCRVDVAANGCEAVSMARQFPYDLILMDCRMPEMDGFTATQAIRSQQSPANRTPIIALTAHTVSGARDECLRAGMDDFLAKPMRPAELEKALLRWTP